MSHQNNKNRKRLLSAARRMRVVMDDTSEYFEANVKHVDDFKVLLTFFRSCHKWSELLAFVAMCDEITCHKMSRDWLTEDILGFARSVKCMRQRGNIGTESVADAIYLAWPTIAKQLASLMEAIVLNLKDEPLDITALANHKAEIAKFKKTRTIAEHKYEDVFEDRYGIPDIEWSGIIKDGETYFADGEDLWDKNLYELCMIISARLSRLYVELVNKAIPMAHATMAFDEFQLRFDTNCNVVKRAFETETKNGHK
ncbi:MAG: hypothetical protein ABIG61_07270 [Planctomycetota bacterium]